MWNIKKLWLQRSLIAVLCVEIFFNSAVYMREIDLLFLLIVGHAPHKAIFSLFQFIILKLSGSVLLALDLL